MKDSTKPVVAGEKWDIRVGENPIGEFTVRSVDGKGNVIGDLPATGGAAAGKLEEVFGPLESALQGFAFAAAHEEEMRLAQQGLTLNHGEKRLRLGHDFEGLVVLFDEARFSFRLGNPSPQP